MMKTKCMKLTSLLLVLCMMLGMVACGKKATVVGTWETEIDFTQMLNETMAEGEEGLEEMEEYFDFEDLTLTMLVEFDEDGKCVMKFEEDSTEKFVENFKDQLSVAMEAYFTEYLAEMGISMEMFVATYGSWDSYFDENFDAESMIEPMLAEIKLDYKLEGDKLYTVDVGGNFDEGECATIELKGDKMVWTEIEILGDGEDSTFEGLLPLEFKRK